MPTNSSPVVPATVVPTPSSALQPKVVPTPSSASSQHQNTTDEGVGTTESHTAPIPSAFNHHLATIRHRDCLPHMRQPNAVYFITFRLADSLPQSKLTELQQQRDRWSTNNPPPLSPDQQLEYRRIWTVPVERMMDAGHGQCLLRDPANRQPLEQTLLHDDGRLYLLGPYVIMPNHVHLLVHVLPQTNLSSLLQAWKSISARTINRQLGRSGSLWLEEYFDHIVRDSDAYQAFSRYIQRNPERLPPKAFTLGQGKLNNVVPGPAVPPNVVANVVPTPSSVSSQHQNTADEGVGTTTAANQLK